MPFLIDDQSGFMRRRTTGFTLIELVVALVGIGVLVASGLIVVLRGASLLYIATMLFPPLGLFLSGRRLRAISVVLLSGALAVGVAAFLLTPARWAEDPTLFLTVFLIGWLGVYAFAYPFLVLWAWDSVRRAWESRRGTVVAEDGTAGSRPSGCLLSRPIVVYPTILVLTYLALTVAFNVLLGSAERTPSWFTGDEVLGQPVFEANLDDFAALYGSGIQLLGLTDLKTSLGSQRATAPSQTWSERWERAWRVWLVTDGYVLFDPVALYLALLCVEAAWLIGRIRRSMRIGPLAPGQDTP